MCLAISFFFKKKEEGDTGVVPTLRSSNNQVLLNFDSQKKKVLLNFSHTLST